MTNGLLDTDMTQITARETTIRAIANLWNKNEEGPYAIRHSYCTNQFRIFPIAVGPTITDQIYSRRRIPVYIRMVAEELKPKDRCQSISEIT
jgi:hypothetical protein